VTQRVRCALAAALGLACATVPPPDLPSPPAEPISACDGASGAAVVTVEYLRAGGFAIVHAGEALLTAPIYSNPSFLRVGLGLSFGSDGERIPARPPLLEGARVAGVLVGHAHYDHLMDVPSVLARWGLDAAPVYGSRTAANADSRHVVYPVTRPGTWVRELRSARLPPEIRIDVRPRKVQNKLRPVPNVPIAVAVLGSEEVDVEDVDLATLAFGPDGAAAERKAKRVDVDGDGFEDLVTRYRLRETGIARGDTEACLTGIADGFEFLSCDAVVTR